MNTRHILITILPTVIVIIISLILLTIFPHITGSSHLFINILKKYFKYNTSIMIKYGKTTIKTTIKFKNNIVKTLQIIYLKNITIGHYKSRNTQTYLIAGSYVKLSYRSLILASISITYRNFTYIIYMNRDTKRTYECFKGYIEVVEGKRRNFIKISGICITYNVSITPFEVSKIYYSNMENILKYLKCRSSSSRISCILNRKVNYIPIILKELNELENKSSNSNTNIRTVENSLKALKKALCHIILKVEISNRNILLSSESIYCTLGADTICISSSSFYNKITQYRVNIRKILADILEFRKIPLREISRSSTKIINILYSIEHLRSFPEPYASIQVLNMPVELIFTLVALHLY